MTRTAIITGASRGIGAAIARRLASDGLAVVVNYARSHEDAAAVVRGITDRGGQAVAAQADVADAQAVRALFDLAEQQFGGVDVLVNNAAIMALAPVAETTDEMFERMLATNLRGTFRGMREAARRLREGGRIINFSSSVVGLYPPTYAAYAATKAAVEAMTHIAAKELGSKRITVNTVAPGPTATEMFLDGKPEAQVDATRRGNPQGRLGEPDEIAAAVAFLASPAAQWISGQTIRVNGGVV